VSPVEAELRMGLIGVEPSTSSILVKHVVKRFMVCKNLHLIFLIRVNYHEEKKKGGGGGWHLKIWNALKNKSEAKNIMV